MSKYELFAKVARYATIVTSIYIIIHFGLNIYFDGDRNKGL